MRERERGGEGVDGWSGKEGGNERRDEGVGEREASEREGMRERAGEREKEGWRERASDIQWEGMKGG